MARPKTIPSEQIVDVARKLFLEQGYTCPTAAIAREAGVSEGTIFKRFGTKDRLFTCAMEPPPPTFVEGLQQRVGTGSMEENLRLLAEELMAYFRELIPRVMRLKAHPDFDVVRVLEREDAMPHRTLKSITNYLHAEIRAGRLRRCDPEIAARVFIGSVHNYVFFESIGVHSRMPMAPGSYVRALVDMLWTGLEPTEKPQ